MTISIKKIRIAVPYAERLSTYPNIGFISLAQALWDTVDDNCEILKLHESELLLRDDFDVILFVRRKCFKKNILEYCLNTDKIVALWYDDLHNFKWRIPHPVKKLVDVFDRVDLIFVTSLHHFKLWRPYRRFLAKVVWSPWSVPNYVFEYSKAWQDKKDKVILSGMNSTQYPLRRHLFKYAKRSRNDLIETLDHPGYAANPKSRGVTGIDYHRLIGSYKGAIATTASTRMRIRRTIDYTVFKYIEIPACGCVPFMEATPDLAELGFVDGFNSISITRGNYKKRLSFIYSKEAEGVARAAQDLIKNRHTHSHRVRLIIDSILDLAGNK